MKAVKSRMTFEVLKMESVLQIILCSNWGSNQPDELSVVIFSFFFSFLSFAQKQVKKRNIN